VNLRCAPLIGAALLLVGCDGDTVHQSDLPVEGGVWDRAWKPEFTVDITDTVSPHNVYIDLRHTGDYPYSDLFLFITATGPGMGTVRDTVDCLLADPLGRWYGKGQGFIFADRVEAEVLYQINRRFPRKGRYTFQLEQAMRTERLPGVIDVGLSVKRAPTQGG
jgi:gliding motility-associated lipoprotein GldH